MPSPLQPFAFDGDFPFLGGNHITVATGSRSTVFHPKNETSRFASLNMFHDV
jgi:hypothetical protein